MTTGTIKRVISERGFGFIADGEGKEYFFHRDGLSDSVDFDRPFSPGSRDGDHVASQDRLFELQPPVLLAGSHQQRRALAKGVVEHAHRIAQAAGDVQVHHAQRSRCHRQG